MARACYPFEKQMPASLAVRRNGMVTKPRERYDHRSVACTEPLPIMHKHAKTKQEAMRQPPNLRDKYVVKA